MSETERFKKPTDNQLIEIAILFNNGKIEKDTISQMLAMTLFVLDRLHEHGTIEKRSSIEDGH
jgi:hypothetical protein